MTQKKSIKEQLAEMVSKKLLNEFGIEIYTDPRDFNTNKGAQPKNDICSWEATCPFDLGYVQLSSYDRMKDLVRYGFDLQRYQDGMNIFELHCNPGIDKTKKA